MSDTPFLRLSKPEETDHDRALRRIADCVHHMNNAVMRAVEAGLSIELVRASRHHDGSGNWGDQMIPLVRLREGAAPSSEEAA